MRKKTDARKHFKKVQIQTRFELNRKLKAAPIAPLTKGNNISCRKRHQVTTRRAALWKKTLTYKKKMNTRFQPLLFSQI